MTITDFTVKPLLVPVFKDGKKVYDSPSLKEIQKNYFAQMDTFWDEYKRLTRPHVYKVDLSDKLYQLKKQLLEQAGAERK